MKNIVSTVLALGIATSSAFAENIQAPTPGQDPINPIIGFLVEGVLASDLVVLPYAEGPTGPQGSGFCGTWDGTQQKVRMVIKNAGATPSNPSQMSLTFRNPDDQSWEMSVVHLPAIAAGQSETIFYPIPNWAWSVEATSKAVFAGAIDIKGATAEKNEDNNVYGGTCLRQL